MSTESLKIETIVDALLASYGVSYSAAYFGLEPDSLGGKTEMDRWKVKFSRDGGSVQEFDFYTGLGLREDATAKEKKQAAWGYQGLTENDKKGLTSYGRRYLADVEKLRKPVSPTAAGVLYCLIHDAEAAHTTFRNWCDEFGYDDDSIKARATYDACQETSDKLQKVFNWGQIEQLSEAVQDY